MNPRRRRIRRHVRKARKAEYKIMTSAKKDPMWRLAQGYYVVLHETSSW